MKIATTLSQYSGLVNILMLSTIINLIGLDIRSKFFSMLTIRLALTVSYEDSRILTPAGTVLYLQQLKLMTQPKESK